MILTMNYIMISNNRLFLLLFLLTALVTGCLDTPESDFDREVREADEAIQLFLEANGIEAERHSSGVYIEVLEENEIPAPTCQVISVPMDFHQDFKNNPDKAIRDFAGLTIFSTNPFIVRREKIQESFDLAAKYGYHSPFNLGETDLQGGIPIPKMEVIRRDVPSFRIAHVDLGLRKDAAGIAIGHLAGFKVGTEDQAMAVLPVIAIDAVMRVVPPHNGEIDFSEIRRFLMTFKEKTGLDLRYVTTDGFQSVDTRQILRKQGFMTDYQSVEKVESSRTMRDALYDGRLLIPAHQHLAKELRELEVTIHNNKEKINHPAAGTKDLADAVTGVVQFIMKRRSTWASISIPKGTGYHFLGNSEDIAIGRQSAPSKQEIGSVEDLSQRSRVSADRKPTIRRVTARK